MLLFGKLCLLCLAIVGYAIYLHTSACTNGGKVKIWGNPVLLPSLFLEDAVALFLSDYVYI